MNSLDREFIDYYNSKLRQLTSNISSLSNVELVRFNSELINQFIDEKALNDIKLINEDNTFEINYRTYFLMLLDKLNTQDN